MTAEDARVLTDVEQVTNLALSVPDQARAIKIKSQEDYAKAGDVLLTVKAIRKKIVETFKPIKQKMDAAKAEVLKQERDADAPLKEAEAILTPQILAWDREQDRLRKEEEARLREIARKQEEDQRLKDALAAEAAGDKETADQIIEEKPYVPPVVLPKATPKVVGMTIRENWKFRITNAALIPREYLTPDMVKIGGVARALKAQTNIPGVEVYNEGTIAGRR